MIVHDWTPQHQRTGFQSENLMAHLAIGKKDEWAASQKSNRGPRTSGYQNTVSQR